MIFTTKTITVSLSLSFPPGVRSFDAAVDVLATFATQVI